MWIGKNSLPAGGVPLQSGRVLHEFHRLIWPAAGSAHSVFFFSVFLAVTLVQKNPPMRSADAPILIWDIDLTLAKALPRNVRITGDPLKASDGKTPSTSGLIDLHASGGGEFTADNLKFLLTRMHGPVTVFDLRQETHIFVNGLPVSWFATRDWAEEKLTAFLELESAIKDKEYYKLLHVVGCWSVKNHTHLKVDEVL
jgi:hypothetical protein